MIENNEDLVIGIGAFVYREIHYMYFHVDTCKFTAVIGEKTIEADSKQELQDAIVKYVDNFGLSWVPVVRILHKPPHTQIVDRVYCAVTSSGYVITVSWDVPPDDRFSCSMVELSTFTILDGKIKLPHTYLVDGVEVTYLAYSDEQWRMSNTLLAVHRNVQGEIINLLTTSDVPLSIALEKYIEIVTEAILIAEGINGN